MSTISSYLERRAHAKNSEHILFTEDGLTIAATAGLGLSHFNAYQEYEKFKSIKNVELEGYQEWESGFKEKFQQRMDLFEEKRFEDHEVFEELLADSGGEKTEELDKFVRNLGRSDKRERWAFEKFFAEEGGESAEKVLGYWQYKNGNRSYVNYTDQQFNQLKDTGKVTLEGETLEIHRINNQSRILNEPELFNTIQHPNNGRIMTGQGHKNNNAHRDDPALGHGGNTRNPTSGEAVEVDSRKDKILEMESEKVENRVSAYKENTEDQISSFNLNTGIGVGIVVGSITSAIEIYKLKNDPRPWKKKALLVTTSSLIRGLEAGTLALIALKTRTVISSFGENEGFQSNIEYVNNMLTNALPGDISSSLDAGNLATYAGFSASIAELRIIRSGIVAIVLWRKSDFRIASNQFGKELMVIIPEESVFFGTAFMIDMLYQAGEDALIPDPTGGFIIAARVGWSVGKKGYQYNENKKTMKICKQKRMDGLYETAITSLVYFG